MKKLSILFVFALLLASCGNTVKIKGHLVCSGGNEVIYLERIAPAGQITVDSVATANGKFAFKVQLPAPGSQLYNLRCGNHLIPLLLRRGERVTVKGFGNVSRNYTVSGSEGSALVRELAMTLNNGAASLDSLSNIFTHLPAGDTIRSSVAREYGREYFRIKQEQIRFIVTNAGSLAALYGLYQRLPNDNTLFNGNESDVVYFRMVADSLAVTEPGSPYLKGLEADIARMQPAQLDPSKIHTVAYPDIELPDMYGRMQKLSAMAPGHVVLIDFWSAEVPQCNLLNAELKELYAELHESGLDVYQVSVDSSKPLWVSSVQEQRLPWTTVCDFRGAASPGVRTYNVQGVPANFLLDRNGNFAGKNLYGKQLADKVKSLL